MSKLHSEQFRQEAVANVLSNNDKLVKAIAQSLGVGYSTLNNWARKASGTVRSELSSDQQRIR
jgi:transposase-like protein